MMRLRSLMAALLALAAAACGGKPEADPGPAPVGQLDNLATPLAYRLDLRIDPREERFSGDVQIRINFTAATQGFWLHGKGLDVTRAELTYDDGRRIPANYAEQSDAGVARVSLDRQIQPGEATLLLSYNAAFNASLEGIYKVVSDGSPYIVTQMEPVSARLGFPGFDQPNFKTPFKVSITAPADNVVIANGAELAAEPAEDGFVKHVFAETQALPTYLIALAVGPYDIVEAEAIPATALRADPVPLRGIAAKGKGERLRRMLDSTSSIMLFLEEYFGVAYPYGKLDLIAAPNFAFGAMENAGAIVYRESVLLMDETTPISVRRGALITHVHELAHQWFGNYVTPVWWDDIWLNESFATWMGHKGAAAVLPEGAYERQSERAGIGAMGVDSLASTRRIREPVTDTRNVLDAFDGITYSKGGGVLAMVENYLGEAAFRDGVRTHMRRFPFGVATAKDFFESLAQGSGQPDLAGALESFVAQRGVPVLEAKLQCEGGAAQSVSFTQSRYAPLGSRIAQEGIWSIPVCWRALGGGDGARNCAIFSAAQQSAPLSGACPAAIMPNAGGAGYYRFDLDEAGWQALIGRIGELDAGEQNALANSIGAAFRAGKVSATTFLSAQAALARVEAWDAASTPTGALAGLADDLLSDADAKARFAAFGQRLYAPRLAALPAPSTAEPFSTTLFRTNVFNFLAGPAADPAIRADLAGKARRFIGSDGASPDRTALSPDLVPLALQLAVEDDADGGFFTALFEVAKAAKDQSFQGFAYNALAETESEDRLAVLRTAILDGVIGGREAFVMIGRMMGNPAAQGPTWEWVKANFAQIAELTPANRKPNLPNLAGDFCTTDARAEVEAFFTANAALVPGLERNLAQTLEQIELCASLRAAKAEEFAAALR